MVMNNFKFLSIQAMGTLNLNFTFCSGKFNLQDTNLIEKRVLYIYIYIYIYIYSS